MSAVYVSTLDTKSNFDKAAYAEKYQWGIPENEPLGIYNENTNRYELHPAAQIKIAEMLKEYKETGTLQDSQKDDMYQILSTMTMDIPRDAQMKYAIGAGRGFNFSAMVNMSDPAVSTGYAMSALSDLVENCTNYEREQIVIGDTMKEFMEGIVTMPTEKIKEPSYDYNYNDLIENGLPNDGMPDFKISGDRIDVHPAMQTILSHAFEEYKDSGELSDAGREYMYYAVGKCMHMMPDNMSEKLGESFNDFNIDAFGKSSIPESMSDEILVAQFEKMCKAGVMCSLDPETTIVARWMHDGFVDYNQERIPGYEYESEPEYESVEHEEMCSCEWGYSGQDYSQSYGAQGYSEQNHSQGYGLANACGLSTDNEYESESEPEYEPESEYESEPELESECECSDYWFGGSGC